MSPWYVVTPPTGAFAALSMYFPIITKFVGLLYAISGAGTMIGAVRGHGKVTRVLLWSSVSMYTLLITIRIINLGAFPIVWVMYLALLGVCAILALYVGRE